MPRQLHRLQHQQTHVSDAVVVGTFAADLSLPPSLSLTGAVEPRAAAAAAAQLSPARLLERLPSRIFPSWQDKLAALIVPSILEATSTVAFIKPNQL